MNLYNDCREKIKWGLERAKEIWGRDFPEPKVLFDCKGTRAGYASLQENEIHLNSILLSENKQDFIDRTPIHELIHLVVYQLYGKVKRSHGVEWRQAMVKMGQEASRCHSFDVTNSKRQPRFVYFCDCEKEWKLTKEQHQKIEDGYEKICRECGESLTRDPMEVTPTKGLGARVFEVY